MKYFILFVVALLLSINLTAQNSKITQALHKKSVTAEDELHVWIYFKDKGTDLTSYYENPETFLSKKSITRRENKLQPGNTIKFSDLPVNENYISILSERGVQVKHNSKWLNAVSGYLSPQLLNEIAPLDFIKKIDIVRKFRVKKDVESAEESRSILKPQRPNDHTYNYGSSYTQLQQINVPAVHDMGITGEGITICVMDAGFNNLPHEVFDEMNIIAAWDFVNNDGNVGDESDMGEGSHGTKTLSTIGGFKEGQLIGPAFNAAYIIAKTENTDSETPVEEDNWIAAMEWADSIGVDVTSTSLGYFTYDSPYDSYSWEDMDGNTALITIAADLAVSKGIVVVNSAGNEYDHETHNTLVAPADGDSVIAAGAVYSDGERVGFSSVGPTADGRIKPDVMAMGSGVVVASSFGTSDYTTASGTSFSCPLSAGVAALILSANPSLTPMQVRDAMRNTASQADAPDRYYGWGILNTLEAINYFRVQIFHDPLSDTEDMTRTHLVNVNLESELDINTDDLFVYYSFNDSLSFDSTALIYTGTGNLYDAVIPSSRNSGTFYYYIKASNASGVTSTLPVNAPNELFSFYVGPDEILPEIIHTPLGGQSIFTWPPDVKAAVTDNVGVDSVYVRYKHNDGLETDFPLLRINSSNEFQAVFPLTPDEITLDDEIRYRVIAVDSSTNQNHSYLPGESNYYLFNVVNLVSYEDNFDTSNGGMISNNDWEWGEPAVSPVPHSGTGLWGTLLNTDYHDEMLSSMETEALQVFDDNCTISFWHWYDIESGYDGGNVKLMINDANYVIIQPDGGYDGEISSSFSNPLSGEEAFTGTSGGWEFVSFDISGYVSQGNEIRIKFDFGSDVSITKHGWFIDDLTVSGAGMAPPVNVDDDASPYSYKLLQNYPNPFNPSTKIKFSLTEPGNVKLSVYNVLGEKIIDLINTEMDAGFHQVQFDGSKLASGIYLYKLQTDNFTDTKKMTLLK
ncbi:MAG: S8 family serine peptidase [Melioribacteraceae bacterium]|nr:S8 family serine peptidase [Melioribacteraceae bacterium]MCF8395309.1 S8 family serine peptidase [Melioribacteraceae bacterium]MCF8420331.1 S8 family serine peptidase [Melioribacteraceae bacterium]